MKKVILAGGSGFIGNYLSQYFWRKGYEVVVLSRREISIRGGVRYEKWNTEETESWREELEEAFILINLSGKSVAVRHNEKNKKEILDSRIKSTRILNQAVLECRNPPQFWFNASGATIYKTSFDEKRDEYYTELEEEFLTNVIIAWEREFFKTETPKVTKIAMRTAVVLGKSGETYDKLNKLSKLGLGGKQGNGNQIMSWIHIEDYARTIEFCVEKNLNGIVNMASPNPVTNEEMMRAFREVNKVPLGIPTPEGALRLGAKIIGIEPDFVLKSYNVVSKRLPENGFNYKYPTIKEALVSLKKLQ
jgi:uncharacterized protein (TIGR01777 family)